MRTYAEMGNRRFSRNADKAIFGGVCAGISDYFGFNRRATRFLAIVAFCMAMPITILAYLAVVFLVPATSGTHENNGDPEFRQALRASPRQAASDVRRRFQSLDRRLARLEKYVTSSRYQLDREIRNL